MYNLIVKRKKDNKSGKFIIKQYNNDKKKLNEGKGGMKTRIMKT